MDEDIELKENLVREFQRDHDDEPPMYDLGHINPEKRVFLNIKGKSEPVLYERVDAPGEYRIPGQTNNRNNLLPSILSSKTKKQLSCHILCYVSLISICLLAFLAVLIYITEA